MSEPGGSGGEGGMGLVRGRSRVWNEFVICEDGKRVSCRRCGDTLSYSHSHSTSSMLKHLKRKHGMDLYPPPEEGGGGAEGSSPPNPQKKGSGAKGPSTPCKKGGMKGVKKEEEPASPPPASSIQHDPLVFLDPCVRMRWADHGETCLRSFSAMYGSEDYTDCILVAERTFFRAHRVLLSSASELLDEMFKASPASSQPLIFLHNVKAVELRILLDFIYKGEVAIPPSLIPSLVRVGGDLRVKGLSDFIWNEQLASTIFPPTTSSSSPAPTQSHAAAPTQTSIPTPVTSAAPSFSTPFVPQQQQIFKATKSADNCNSKIQAPSTHNIQTPVQAQPTKTYGRVGSNSGGMNGQFRVQQVQGQIQNQSQGPAVSSASNSSSNFSSHQMDPPPFKRFKIVDSTVRTTFPSTAGSDTVLMVTSQGESLLSSGQGSVTLMGASPISLPVSFAIKDENNHSYVTTNGQPVTILSDSQGLDEVVYSIAEVPGGGHEVLMSEMDQGSIVVYETGDTDSSVDKKLYPDRTGQ